MWFQTFLDLLWEADALLWNWIRMFPPGGIPLSRRVYTSWSTNSKWVLQVWKKLRIPKAIAKPPESLKSLKILETLSGLIAQKTLNKPEQLENAKHKKEMLETLKTQHNYKKQRTFKKQRNCIIRKTTLPPAAGRDVPHLNEWCWFAKTSNQIHKKANSITWLGRFT